MDIFDTKAINPMLIAELKEPFNSDDYIYELKFDGIRCIAYFDPDGVDLRNKRDMRLLPRFPELGEIHKNVKDKCILDGELFVLKNGITDFYEVQRRTMMTDQFKIRLAASKNPASFVAYDIIYYKNKLLTDLPLIERKELLESVVEENERIAVSRYIENAGIQLFELAKAQKLEGVVAKKKSSKYWFDKRSKDWIKFKVLNSEDFVLCGYILKPNNMTSFIIGQYDGDKLIYKGHVTLGAYLRALNQHRYVIRNSSPFGYTPPGNEDVKWLEPTLVCIIESMPNDRENMRQAVFKGIRTDKLPKECQINMYKGNE